MCYTCVVRVQNEPPPNVPHSHEDYFETLHIQEKLLPSFDYLEELNFFFNQRRLTSRNKFCLRGPIYMAGQIPYYQMSALHIPVTDPLVLGSPVVYLIP